MEILLKRRRAPVISSPGYQLAYPCNKARHGRSSGLQRRGGPGEFMGGVAHIHTGIVQHQIANIDQMTIEDQGADRFGHVAAGLPAGGQAGALQPGIEAQNGNRDLLEPTGDGFPRQVRQSERGALDMLLVPIPMHRHPPLF
jgi:hypothetical protein